MTLVQRHVIHVHGFPGLHADPANRGAVRAPRRGTKASSRQVRVKWTGVWRDSRCTKTLFNLLERLREGFGRGCSDSKPDHSGRATLRKRSHATESKVEWLDGQGLLQHSLESLPPCFRGGAKKANGDVKILSFNPLDSLAGSAVRA